ncbi:hypothetical protein IQ06DRAFT_296138 [Phaeosphaeriaceae sp. SRC1lsM3a]|nr:hypothetical protein IQ06DRAFT_296138 [Stagonospora sp. SRC1lsM3a]
MAPTSTKESVIALTKLNLFDVFGETDATKRLAMIRESWVPSGECHFVDPNGVFKTHESINDMVTELQKMIAGQEFREMSDYTVLAPDTSNDIWVAQVRWGVGPPDGEPSMTGLDVVTVVAGKIKACYTFIDGPK